MCKTFLCESVLWSLSSRSSMWPPLPSLAPTAMCNSSDLGLLSSSRGGKIYTCRVSVSTGCRGFLEQCEVPLAARLSPAPQRGMPPCVHMPGRPSGGKWDKGALCIRRVDVGPGKGSREAKVPRRTCTCPHCSSLSCLLIHSRVS